LAENKYINDIMKITMRTGPGTNRKIIALVGIGQKVEVVRWGGDWTLIRLTNGKEGWVISRFLTDKIPSSIELKELKSKYKALMNEAATMQEADSLLKAENKKLSTKLAASRKKFQKTSNKNQNIKWFLSGAGILILGFIIGFSTKRQRRRSSLL